MRACIPQSHYTVWRRFALWEFPPHRITKTAAKFFSRNQHFPRSRLHLSTLKDGIRTLRHLNRTSNVCPHLNEGLTSERRHEMFSPWTPPVDRICGFTSPNLSDWAILKPATIPQSPISGRNRRRLLDCGGGGSGLHSSGSSLMAGITRTGRNWGTQEGSNGAREIRGWGALLQFGTWGLKLWNGGPYFLIYEESEENHPREKHTSYHDGIKTGRGMMKRGLSTQVCGISLLGCSIFGEKCLSIPRFLLG